MRKVADRLRRLCADDGSTIGRLGGDGFAVIVPNDDPAHVEDKASRLIAVLTAPYGLTNDRTAQIGASVGIAMTPRQGLTTDLLMARADIALYAAKRDGKGTFGVFRREHGVCRPGARAVAGQAARRTGCE